MDKVIKFVLPVAATATTMLNYFRTLIIPTQSYSSHKGQGGRIAFLGGSEEYTGAPYYAAMSSLKAGGDIASIVCDRSASVAIKSYSPELIVYPYIDSQIAGNDNDENLDFFASKIDNTVLSRSHALVIGPGLGRNTVTMNVTTKVIDLSRKRNLPLVIDGDGLWLLQSNLDLIKGYKNAILTPNANEFKQLYKAAFGDEYNKDKDEEMIFDILKEQNMNLSQHDDNGDRDSSSTVSKSKKEKFSDLDSMLDYLRDKYHGFGPFAAEDHKHLSELSAWRLAKHFGNVTILMKGKVDVITNGKILAINSASGSPRRCGGQGDVLAGTTGLFAYYASNSNKVKESNNPKIHELGKENNLYVIAAFGSSILTRESNRLAYLEHNRSTTTPNMIESIGKAFDRLFESSPIASDSSESHNSNQSTKSLCATDKDSSDKSSL